MELIGEKGNFLISKVDPGRLISLDIVDATLCPSGRANSKNGLARLTDLSDLFASSSMTFITSSSDLKVILV
ncbi:hypothetical protein [Sulfuracidifex metallicus]|uniref:hypothetical protein n=1 Tax=Sulfuracidifex metallicus TaxID=47303 RepID=UPI0012EE09DA|nr:hypothetical protein [Sulfuracidifex metallicus]